MDVWVFGYGSLIWRPDIAHRERRVARLRGWARRFWQGSHDHRGVPHAPGRVVTLVPEAHGECGGVAYRIESTVADAAFTYLDHREKNGYERHEVALDLRCSDDGFDSGARRVPGVVYIASGDNHAFLGPAPLEMIGQIRQSAGPSGRNADYLLDLAQALRSLDIDDDHVFELERALLDG